MKAKTRNRVLASLLALVMVLGMLPMGALAAWVDDVPLAALPKGEEVVSAEAPASGAGRTLAGEYTPEQAEAEGKEVHYLAFDAAGFTNGTTATAVTFLSDSGATVTTALATNTLYRIVCNGQVMSGIYTSAPDTVAYAWPSSNATSGGTAYQFKLLAGANGGYKLQSQHGGAAYCLTHGIKENVRFATGKTIDTYIFTTAGEEFYVTPVSDGTDGSYYIWWAVEPQQTPYTPADAVAEGKDVYYFSKATFGWSLEKNSTASAAITVNAGGTAVTGGLAADTEYTFAAGGTNLYAPFSNAGAGVTNVTAQGSAAAAFRLAPEAADGHAAYKIKVSSNGTDYYLTHTEVPFTFNNNSWKGIQLDTAGEAFYITPAADPNDGTYYIWYAAEREDPDPGETIEHHTPTEGMNQHYLQFSDSSLSWIGAATIADIRLDKYADGVYTQYTDADVASGTYAIHSESGDRWMHVDSDTINRCSGQEDINAHRFVFAYDANTHGYTIQSKQTSKYLHADRNALSMSTEGTIFYIDKVDNTNFYHVWWESEIRSGEAISGMFDAAPDNTWVFTGGEDVAGGWAQTGGKRNFMGHFEEYVRWTYGQSSASGDSTTKERYTVNTAYAGLTLADIVGDWNKYVAKYNPRAAVYMVGAEDKDDASFGAHLNAFIDKATALRSGNGFAVIMKSYDSDLAALNAAVDTVVEGLKSNNGKYSRVVVATTTLTDAQLTDDGHPNAAGHLELSKQLVTAACPNSNTGGNFPAPSGGAGLKTLQEVASPETYDKTVVPAVNVTEGTMTVTLNGVDAFRYELRLDNGVTISGAGANGSATVTDVPENVSYTLVTRSADGATQYKTVTTEEAELTALQQKLVAKVNDKTTPLTWLFMGDSITHACHWLSGYDSVAQLTEDYLGTIGRDRDVVINTAVSSATTASTLANIDYRLKQFPAPDVASIMLGTNDCGGIDAATTYKTNLNSIIAAIREKNADAIIILRSPTGSWTPRAVGPYCEAMKEVAEAQGCIYIDQYTETQGMLDTYSSWIRNNTTSFPNQVYYGNNLHPGAKAQLDMAKMFFKGTGLWDEDNPISNHDYVLTTAENSATSVGGALTHETGTLTLNVGALGGGLGEVTLTATKGGQSWSVTAKAGTDPALTLPDGTYTVTASGIKTSAAKTVTFASAEVKVGEEAPPIEIETSGYPDPDAGKVQNYLDFGSSWVSVTAPAALELHKVDENGVYTKDTDGIDTGVYGIYDPTTDNGTPRWMHVSGGETNQCDRQHMSGENLDATNTTHRFTFTYNAEKRAYTIRSVNNGKYLTQTRSGSQFAVTDEPAWFYVSPANPENNDGTYYIWWETEPQLGGAISEMFNNDPDNTWVFTGGVDVEGGWAQTKGHRNFMGHFEEYVRGQLGALGSENQAGEGSFSRGRQRYTTNTAYTGLTLHTIVTHWSEHVSGFSPKAAVYMVGSEDANSETFSADLTSFIDQALALKDNNGGFAVIIKSYKDELSELNTKVDSVVEEYRTTAAKKYSHIVVVDALPLTNDQKTEDGHPNAAGHSALGENLVTAVYGSATNYPANGNPNLNFDEKAAPTTYDKATAPTVTWSGDDMTIALTGEFTYAVKQGNGVTVSGTATGTATVTGLTAGESYTLVTRNTDGTTQYQTVTGLVGGGEVPAKTGDQAKLATLLANNRNNALTWLFMGDSITHGSAHTRGYDSVSQTFDKYLDMIGRPQDVVINSAVSSAETRSTMYAIDYRLKCFPAPDVVAIMLGTNDHTLINRGAYTLDDYVTYLGQIVAAIREKNENAIIILRAPTGDYGATNNRENVWARMKQYATENHLIFVDPNPTFTGYAAYSWTAPSATPLYFGNALHPGAQGQLAMAQMLIKAAGLWDEDTPIANLEYLRTDMTTERSDTSVSGAMRVNGSQLSLSVSALGANLGRTTLTATNAVGQSWSVTAEAGETPSLTLPDGAYTVTASSVKTNEAKTVTFTSGTVEIDANAEPSKMPAPAEPKAYEYVLDTDGVEEGVYSIVSAAGRVVGMHDSGETTNQCGATVTQNDNDDTVVGIMHNEHKWTFVQREDKYAIRSNGGKYLTSTASGKQLVLSTEEELFTVTHTTNGEYTVQNATGKYLAFPDTNATAWGFQDGEAKVRLFRETEVELGLAQTEFKGTNDRPMDPNDPDSYYRIPSLTTLSNGWLMATSDIRWFTTFDSPNNLDTIVSISKDGGKTWEYEVVNYFADYAAPNKNLAVTYNANKGGSASFIDPSVVQSKVTDEVYLLVDLQPPYVNGGKIGTGFDSEGRLLVGYIPAANGYTMDNGHNNDLKGYTYDYYVDINSAEAGAERTVNMTALGGAADKVVKLWPICAAVDDSQTGYYADAFFNTYYDYGEDGFKPVIAVQHDSAKRIHNNLFYTQSDWKAFPTAFIMLRKATVTENGLAWGAPYLLNAQIKHDNEHFIGVCPGRGTVATVNGKERIIFPLYDSATGNELASVIYSDDGGATWTRGARTPDVTTNNTGKSSESQIVVLPDGNGGTFLRMYSRNGRPTISYADSHDGGATWSVSVRDSALNANNQNGQGCMVSFINVAGVLRGPDGTVYDNLIMGAYPQGTANGGTSKRSNGAIRIGSYSAETGSVTWLNEEVTRYRDDYIYSCLTQKLDGQNQPTDSFALLYETVSDVPNSAGNDFTDIRFDSFTAADIMGENWDWALTEEALPPFEGPVAPTLPEGAVWAYVSFTSGTPGPNVGWGTSAEPYSITLYKESATNTNGEKVTSLTNGVYKLWSGTRWMHVDNTDNKDKTNQCTGNDNAHNFRFTSTGDGYFTIKSVASTSQDRYLNIGELGSYNQLPCTEIPTKFVVEKVDGQDGVFTIKTAVYPAIQFKSPVTTGINQTLTYQQVTERGAVKGDGTMYAVIAPNVNGGTRAMWATDTATDNYAATLNSDETRVTLAGDANRQLWGLQPVEGGYKVISRQHRKCLTTTASGKHLALNATGSVFTVETGAESGTFYLKSGTQYLSWNDGWKMASAPFALKLYTPVLETLDLTGREEAQLLFSGTGSDQPCKPGLGGSNQFRIPALITLTNGWLVAAADVRWSHGVDNPSNLETIVSVSKDNGQTWDWEFVNYFGDYDNTVSDRLSTAFIDPALIQDPATGKVWMLVDVTSADGKGTSGSTGFDGQDRLLVAHVPAYVDQKAPGDASLYTYYVSKAGTEFTVNGAAVTLYPIESSTGATDCDGLYVDAFYNIYHVNGGTVEREMVVQHGSDKIVQDNLFFRQSEWRVFPTCYLMFRSAEVNEATGKLEWSDPIFTNLRGTTPGAGAAFFGAGPGRGFVADDGRILFTAYDNVGGEHASSIYSDDHGATWQRGGRAQNTVGNKTSESQIIRLPDGSLRMYSRNVNSRYVSYSDSTDGGETWGVTKLDEGWGYCSNCMISVINAEGTLTAPDGTVYDNIIVASYPEGNGQYTNAYAHRNTGVVRFGSVGTDADHTVTWLGEVNKLLGTADFVYSCLTQIQVDGVKTDRFGWLYEPYATRGHGINDVTYKELTVAEVLGEGWVLTVKKPDEPEEPKTYTVTFTGEGVSESPILVEEGSTVDLPEPVREGYTFDGWFNGEIQFTAVMPVNENLTLTAHWTEIIVIEPNDWGNVALAVTPNPVAPGGILQVTVTDVPENATGLTLTLEGNEIALNRSGDGVYTGTVTAPDAAGARVLAFVLSAEEYAPKLLQAVVTVSQPTPPTPSGGGGGSGTGTRPTTPVEEDLNDPDVPLANGPMLYEDVKAGDWFYDAAKFVASAGLMMGVSETRFAPSMNTTRGMIVTILYRMEKEPGADPATFLDVPQDAWYSAGAAWGEMTGVAKGMSDGNFHAMNDVTREQLAAFLFRFAEHRGYDVSARGDLTVFHDGAAVSGWAEDAMRWAVATGLITGKGAGGLDPLSTATRGEVATILMRFCQTMEGEAE